MLLEYIWEQNQCGQMTGNVESCLKNAPVCMKCSERYNLCMEEKLDI